MPSPEGGGARQAAPLLLLAALPIAVLFAFVVGIALGVRGTDVAILGLALLTGALALVPLAVDQGRPPENRHILLSLVSASYIAFFVLPVFSQYLLFDGVAFGAIRLSNVLPEDILRGQAAALLGLVCLLAGYMMPAGRVVGDVVPKLRLEWSERDALLVAMVMIPVGWAMFLLGQFRLIPGQLGSGVLGSIVSWYISGIALLTVIYHRYQSRTAVLLLIVFIPPTMAFSFFTGSKTLFLAPLAMVVLTRVVITRKIRLRWVVAGVLVISVLYPIASFYRDFVQAGNRLGAVQVLRDPVGALLLISNFASQFHPVEYLRQGFEATGARFDAMGITSVIVRDTPSPVPFQNGRTIALIPIAYIPRVIWPGKPITTIGTWVTDNYVSVSGVKISSATGPSWVGELYFNFGYLGIVGGMLVLGFYFRFLHTYFFYPKATILATFVGALVLFDVARSLGGGLIQPTNGVVFKIAPILLIHPLVVLFGNSRRRAHIAQLAVREGQPLAPPGGLP